MTHDTISLIEKLRTVTKDCHERLHEHPLTCSLGSTCLTKREYVITLCAFQKFYENIMAEVSKIDNDFCFDQIRLIKNDLQNLGYEVNPLKQCRYLTLAQNKDALWGVLYVTEGSKLGGQLISKNIKKVLNLHHDTGNSFFFIRGEIYSQRLAEFYHQHVPKCKRSRPLCDCS